MGLPPPLTHSHAHTHACTHLPPSRCLEECLANLQAALDSRVFVAVGRGLWDFIGRQMYDFIEQLQVRLVF